MSKSIGEVECKSRPADLLKSRPVELQKVGQSNCKKSAGRIAKSRPAGLLKSRPVEL
jgi:hypothetical protein